MITQLLDCFTIPVVLLLSWLCVRVRYGIVHVLGVCLALVGVGCLVYADIEDGRADMQRKYSEEPSTQTQMNT